MCEACNKSCQGLTSCTCRTQAQAKKAQAATKKAVTHVKEVATHVKEEIHAQQQVLAKHKLPFETSPLGRAPGEHPADAPRPLLYVHDLLRRSTGEVGAAGACAAMRSAAQLLRAATVCILTLWHLHVHVCYPGEDLLVNCSCQSAAHGPFCCCR